jgi:hypothetical protein
MLIAAVAVPNTQPNGQTYPSPPLFHVAVKMFLIRNIPVRHLLYPVETVFDLF